MRWIGLTGGIATGKSSVSRILRANGLPVVDADQLARDVVQPGTPGHLEVTQAFGRDVVLPSGELDRKKIASLVFNDPSLRAKLEGIIHPKVRKLAEEKRKELESQGHDFAFYDVPLLYEKKMQSLFDVCVVVATEPKIQLERLLKRDEIEKDEAEKKIKSQLPIQEKAKLADYVVRNNGSLEDLEKSVEALLKFLRQKH